MLRKSQFLIVLYFISIAAFGQLSDRQFIQQNSESLNDSAITDIPWKQSSIVSFKKDTAYRNFMFSISKNALVESRKKNSLLLLSPEILLSSRYESEAGENYFTYGGGAQINYAIGNKFLLNARIIGFQEDALSADSVRGVNNLSPGVYWSNYSSGVNSVFDIRARVAYRPSKYFQFETGVDNNFVGDGYHSVLMGNDVAPYPFAMVSTSFWKIDYNVQYHFLKDVAYPDLEQMNNKYMTTHQLNFRATPKLHFYVWEAVVWKQEDSIVQRGYDLSYLNPVIFFRPVEFQLGSPSPDNVLIGFGFRYQPFRWLRVYGQGLLDEFYLKEIQAQDGWWANKFAFQLGVRSRFNLKDHSFSLLGEFNMARPFTYTHISSMQNYGTKLYPMAHPLGANFAELVFVGKWQYRQFGIKMVLAATTVGTDEENINYGQNIYRSYTDRESEYGHSWLQGNTQKNISVDVRANYIINEAYHLKLSVGARSYPDYYATPSKTNSMTEVYVRLATYLSSGMRELYKTRHLFE